MLSIDMTPLIDVVFLLLIFFMVGTTFIELNTGIKIELPNSNVKELSKVKEVLVLVDKAENIELAVKNKDGSLENVKVKLEELESILKEKLESSENKNVIIKADKNLTHGVIVSIMTHAKNAGAQSLDIATENQNQ